MAQARSWSGDRGCSMSERSRIEDTSIHYTLSVDYAPRGISVVTYHYGKVDVVGPIIRNNS